MSNCFDPEDPQLLKFNAARLAKRDIDQLLGICEFSLLDGHIDQAEAESIYSWLQMHTAGLDLWPANVLYDRLRTMLADGVLDEDEQHELLTLISSIVRPRTQSGEIIPISLPVDHPEPKVVIPGKQFCFTGVFDFGTRADCHAAVEKLGGEAIKGITKHLDYLVIGSIGSESWRHTSFGSKIEKAVGYRDSGVGLAIITEKHWVQSL